MLSFGVNDCESRLEKIDSAQVWSMLAPLPCATPPCAACVEAVTGCRVSGVQAESELP